MPSAKFRSVCWTLNNYTEADVARLSDATQHPEIRYLGFGREVGESGTPHLQGFAYSDGPRGLAWWKERLSLRAHIEKTKGRSDQAIAYCRKDGDYTEWGTPPKTAEQRGADEAARWEEARKAAQAGNIDDIPADIYVRYYRTLKEIKKDHMQRPADAENCTGQWICGRAGIGKSRMARETAPDAYLKMANKWWDGYQGESHVIIDDLDKAHHVLAHHLKIWSDRYAFLAETKGGALCIRPEKIIVTSQYTIEEIWEDSETRDALNRRFEIINLGM